MVVIIMVMLLVVVCCDGDSGNSYLWQLSYDDVIVDGGEVYSNRDGDSNGSYDVSINEINRKLLYICNR